MAMIVNGEYLDDSLLRREAELLRQQLVSEYPGEDELTVRARAWECARETIIDRLLIKQAALAHTKPLPPGAIEAALQNVRQQSPGQSGCIFLGSDEELRTVLETELRTEQFIADITSNLRAPKNSEVADYYRKRRSQFYTAELIHASHIVKNVDERVDETTALAGITEAARALEMGIPFAKVADTYSDCPGRGGDLGFFGRGEMVEEFEAVVFAQREGEISPIFRSPFGFHIALLHEKRPEGVRPLSEVRAEIESAILNEKRDAAIRQTVSRLREQAKIQKSK